jgi:hypothetical protein
LAITRGTFNFSNAAASVTTLTVGGNTAIGNGAGMIVVGGGTANTNTLSTPGSITNSGTMNFNNTGVVNITFTGTNDVTFGGTGSGGTTLSLITINKGSSQAPTVDFSVGGTITAATSGWLTLTNGTFNWNNASTGTISTASATYSIPPTAKLKVNLGTVNVLTANNTAADLLLNGAIEISGGTMNIGSSANTIDNDIEYASAGSPTIIVSGAGALNVNGSIRRSTSTITGALVYNQTGGAVTVAGKAANTTRGVFEIDANIGSSFTLTGAGSLTVQRQTGGTGYADVFINPVTSNISSTSTITVGLSTATTQANLRVNIAPTIGNFSVANGAGTNAQTVNLFSNPMILGGTLTIPTPSVLVTNSLDVTIAGNLTTTGTYTGGTNTTTFNGTGAQAGTLSATSTFTNMTVSKTGGTTLTLSGTAPSLTNLSILSGILDVGTLALTVSGNITNNSSQVGTGTINFSSAATTHTITTSNGSFTNLSLGVAAAAPVTKTITVNGNMTMNGILDFTTFGTNRYLFIGSNLLTFATGATVSNAGTNRFVKTNGVSSDLGVLKNWPVGTNSFTYSVGTRTNYTPVTFTNLVVSPGGAGTLTAVPVDRQHPTASASGEQLLSYYWSLKKGSTLVHNATGTIVYQIPTGLIGGAGGTLVGAYLDAINLIGWTSGGVISVSPPNTLLTFTNALNTILPAGNGQFDYTYGTTNTLPSPITPVYSRFADADGISNPTSVNNVGVGGGWATAANWTLAATGNGAPLGAAPTSRPVVILPTARINLDILGQNAFTTVLSGLLVVTTTGHNIGSISGTGTMRTTTSTLPAGIYTTFTSASGGTIEYAAAIPMNSRSTYNNLLISSTVSMTNTDLTINGNLTIGSGNTLDNSSFGRNINLLGNWTNGGTFTAGTGTVTFNGTAAQTIGGTASTTFYGLTLNNSFGTAPQITLARNTTSTNALTMTSGIVNLAGFTYTLGASGAASTLSRTASTTTNWMYGGTVCRFWPASTAISSTAGNLYGLYPVGAATASSYRPVAINSTVSPTVTGSYCVTHTDATTTTDLSPVYNDAGTNIVRKHNAQFVTSSSGLTDGTYDIAVTMTGLVAGTLSDIRLAVNGAGTTVTNVGTHVPATGTAPNPTAGRTGVALASLSGDFRITTTNLIATPLPIELISFDASLAGDQVTLSWVTASELNNDFFTIERASDIEKFEEVAIVKGQGTTNSKTSYSSIDDSPLPGTSYYRLKQTDFDGGFGYSEVRRIENSDFKNRFRIYPNPVVNYKFNFELIGIEPGIDVPLRIVNMQGGSVFDARYTADKSGRIKSSVELSYVASGMYIVIINTATGLRKKIVIP